jgi:hypothetical protein
MFSDIDGPLIDIKLRDAGARLEFTEVRHQIAKSERGMNIFRVECGEHDIRHPGRVAQSCHGVQCAPIQGGVLICQKVADRGYGKA